MARDPSGQHTRPWCAPGPWHTSRAHSATTQPGVHGSPPPPRSELPTVALVSTAVVTGSYFIPVRRGAGYGGGGGGGGLAKLNCVV